MSSQTTIPSLSKGFSVFFKIVTAENGISLSQLSKTFQLPRTTLTRILNTLEEDGFISENGKVYVTGDKGILMALMARNSIQIADQASPFLKRLSEVTNQTSHLICRQDKKVIVMAVNGGPTHIRISSRPGNVTTIHSSAGGKVLLAYQIGLENIRGFLEHVELEKRTRKTITSLNLLTDHLKIILQQGYAVDDREHYNDVRCIAAPVRDASSKVIAAMGVTAPITSLTKEMVPETANEVIQVCNDFSNQLGWIG